MANKLQKRTTRRPPRAPAGRTGAGHRVSDVPIGPITRETLSVRVAQALENFVAQKRLHAGDRLPSERNLSQSFQVSIPVVREALRMLETKGVLRTYHGRGIFVRDPAQARSGSDRGGLLADTTTAELATARVAFELGIVDLMCARVTDADCDALDAVLPRATTGESFTVHTDMEFHLRLLQITRNPALIHIGDGLLRQFFRLTAMARPDVALAGHSTNGVADQLERHRALVRALRRRDAEALRTLILHHLDNVPGFKPW